MTPLYQSPREVHGKCWKVHQLRIEGPGLFATYISSFLDCITGQTFNVKISSDDLKAVYVELHLWENLSRHVSVHDPINWMLSSIPWSIEGSRTLSAHISSSPVFPTLTPVEGTAFCPLSAPLICWMPCPRGPNRHWSGVLPVTPLNPAKLQFHYSWLVLLNCKWKRKPQCNPG